MLTSEFGSGRAGEVVGGRGTSERRSGGLKEGEAEKGKALKKEGVGTNFERFLAPSFLPPFVHGQTYCRTRRGKKQSFFERRESGGKSKEKERQTRFVGLL